MKRNPELARQVLEMPELINLRHVGVDKVTALSMAIQQLSRGTEKSIQPTEQFTQEKKVHDLLIEALYAWNHYINVTQSTYEYLLQSESNKKTDLLREGGEMIQKHINDLEYLKDKREGVQ